MRERPILFRPALVRAILRGDKTQTRRVVKGRAPRDDFTPELNAEVLRAHVKNGCPYGAPGDRLWVREAYAPRYFDNGAPAYRADWHEGVPAPEPKWKPSIHMPRAACRLVLEIEEVRLERLQEITDKDAWAEGTWTEFADECARKGWAWDPVTNGNPPRLFRESWDRINAKRGYGWDANPWVWAITFRRVSA